MSHYAIKGIPLVPGGGVPVRQEINAWVDNPSNKKQLDLFLVALKKMQETKIEDMLSYHRIAGIHGYPLTEWDGVKYEALPSPNSNVGFCTHNLSIFSTWHRPYMILFEQRLHELMIEIIEGWGLSDEQAAPWLHAAHNFRLPYWDWAQKQPYLKDYGIPQVCILETVTVDLPKGIVTFNNPLAKYSDPKGRSMGNEELGIYKIKDVPNAEKTKIIFPASQCIGTSRYGIYSTKEDPPPWAKGVNNWESVNQMIQTPKHYGKGQNSKQNFADMVERLLNSDYYKTFDKFCSTEYNDPNNPKDTEYHIPNEIDNTEYLSLEYIHNLAHINIGGNIDQLPSTGTGGRNVKVGLGHMSQVPLSAFDPVFFIHHCNIDRLTAIWQTLNEDQWFTPDMKIGGTESKRLAAEWPLSPFHITKSGESWDSNKARNWTQYGYQYSELVTTDEDFKDGQFSKELYLRRLRGYFAGLYKGTSNFVDEAPTFQIDDGQFNDYIINILYDRLALGGHSYSIMLFLGEPPDDVTEYTSHPNYLGQVYTFSTPIDECSNCKSQNDENVLSKAQIPITIQLMEKASFLDREQVDQDLNDPIVAPDLPLGSLEPERMRGVFQRYLKIRYVEFGGEILDPARFKKTEIAVLQAPAGYKIVPFGDETVVEPRYNGRYEILYKYMEDQAKRPLAAANPEQEGRIRSDPVR